MLIDNAQPKQRQITKKTKEEECLTNIRKYRQQFNMKVNIQSI